MNKVRCPKHEQAHWRKYWDKKNSNKTGKQSSRYGSDKRYNETKRSQTRDKFYQSSKWRKYRKTAIMRVNNECAVCGNISQDRKVVDHIYPYRLDKSLANALGKDATMVLCNADHNIKTKLETMILDRPDGKDKLRAMSKDDWVKLIRKYKGGR